MTAGEDEREPLVRYRGVGVSRHGCVQVQQQLALPLERAVAPDPVDRAVLRHGHDPGPGIPGGAVTRPALDGQRKGLLHGVLGALEIAERARKHCDGAPPLLPEDGFDACYVRASAGICMTGRTSTEP